MEKQTPTDSQQPEALYIDASFPYASLRQTLVLLDCSKFYLYKLIRQGTLTPSYLERNKAGKPCGKPYFLKKSIQDKFFTATK